MIEDDIKLVLVRFFETFPRLNSLSGKLVSGSYSNKILKSTVCEIRNFERFLFYFPEYV